MRQRKKTTVEMIAAKIDEATELLAELKRSVKAPPAGVGAPTRAAPSPAIDLEDLDKVERLLSEVKRSLSSMMR
jgi:hypothetical protein